MFNNSTFFIGLDLGDKHYHIPILDQDGVLAISGQVKTIGGCRPRNFRHTNSINRLDLKENNTSADTIKPTGGRKNSFAT